MWSRIVVIAHVWPGITPHNVWDLDLDGWLVFAAAADNWSTERSKSSSSTDGDRRRRTRRRR